MNAKDMNNTQYSLLFDVRRSVRYHDRRCCFFDRLHHVTGALTVLLAGSVLFDIARPGDNPLWLSIMAVIAAILSSLDMVMSYSTKSGLHRDLKKRFVTLEMDILSGDASEATWGNHQRERLLIEKDEPPVYRVLDLLCHDELLRAEGIKDPDEYSSFSFYKRLTRHFFHWADEKHA